MLDLAAFRDPESRFRPAPFWAINDVLDPDEVERQARDLVAHGYSGGFFHSRHGLASPYMGEVWFECLRRVLKVAKETGTYVYLYDEDLWPSGNAGGQVAATDDAFRGRFMLGYLGAPTCQNPECERLGYYRLRGRRGGVIEGFECVEGCQIGPADHEVLYVCCHPDAKRGWWSGESYCNLLEPKVTEKFLELTFDRYAEQLGEHFGKEVRAIFTDEPNPCRGPASLPYADHLAERFEAEYGEPMADGLPWLFLDGPGARKFRQRYRRMVNKVFLEAFTIPLGKWCEKHGIALTGHYNSEDSLFRLVWAAGGSVMVHYEHMQMPGIDHLCNMQIPALTMKQISSSLNQTGTPVALSELFGVSRHTATFEDLKWMADWHFANGVTFFCPHLTLYSFAGRRKRDYPPTFSDHQTYWPQTKPLHDYFARTAAAFDGTARGRLPVHTVAVREGLGQWHGQGDFEDLVRQRDFPGTKACTAHNARGRNPRAFMLAPVEEAVQRRAQVRATPRRRSTVAMTRWGLKGLVM